MSLVDQPDFAHEDLTDLDLTCPACSANLFLDDTFLTARVCGTCRRHFSISARERIGMLADQGTFEEFIAPDPIALDGLAPELVPSAERLAELRDRQVLTEAVVTGTVRIGGVEAAIILLDDHLVGSSLGATLVEKIVEALGQAIGHKLPIVLVCTGGARTPAPGPLSVVQPGRLASAFAQVHVAGLPVMGVLVHPVATSIHAMLATHTDILIAEPGARIGAVGSHPDAVAMTRPQLAQELLAAGWLDDVVDRVQLRGVLAKLLDLLMNPGNISPVHRQAVSVPPGRGFPDAEPMDLPSSNRPDANAMQSGLLTDIFVLRGDRVGGDVAGVTTGFARLESLSVAFVIITDDARTDVAAAARKIARLARFASRQESPVVILIDEKVPTADQDLDITSNQAVATLASLLAVLPVPLVAVGINLIATPLALALFAADRQFLLAHGRLVSGEVASNAGGMGHRLPNRSAIGGVSLSARDCQRLGLIDDIIEEPASGADVDPAVSVSATRVVIAGALAELVGIGPRRLLDTRYRRQWELGLSTPEGLAAVRSELWEIQEWQRSLGKSIDDLRERWDQFRSGAPRESVRRIEVPDLVARLRSRRDELLSRAGRTERGSSESAPRDDTAGR